MPKPISLSVHKNQRARRHAKEMRDDIRLGVEIAQRDFGTDWRGYVLVMWDDQGSSMTNWAGVESLGVCPLDEFARIAIGRKKAKRDVADVLYPEDDGA